MKVMKFVLTIAGLACLMVSASTLAQNADFPGSEDHPMVTRYTGAFIDGYEVKGFDEYVLALGPVARNEQGKRIPKEQVNLEGRITRILYRGPDGRSTLEIYRNYESALHAAGFETLFTCSRDDCGHNFSGLLYGPMAMRINSTESSKGAFDIPQDIRYLAAKMVESNRTIHVSLMVAFDNGFGPLRKRAVTLLEIIEAKAMDTGMVTVDAEAIGKGIDSTGHMAIYGVLFDTGSANIKPESAPVLAEIAKLLEGRPSLNILVVGHTDNEGSHEYNMNLSSQRANSVVRYLAAENGVQKSRMKAAGVGFLAPVASNDSAAGRAKNRRVELVKRF